MEKKELLLSNGNTLYYKVLNGTYYSYAIKLKDGSYEERDEREMEKVMFALENSRQTRKRVRIWYGDVDTGRSWNEEYDVVGAVHQFLQPFYSFGHADPSILKSRRHFL